MKLFLILLLVFLSTNLYAELHYSKDGELLDPGMYWAIHARNKLTKLKEGKGDKDDMMNNLKVSASYGFKPAMLSMSAIYQNGDYGFEQDLPMAFAWWIMSMGESTGSHTKNIAAFKKAMTNDQIRRAEELIEEYTGYYSQAATIGKFERWYKEATAVTGSKLGGDHSYLNLQIQTNGRTVSATEFFKRLSKLQDARLNDLYRVIPQEIITKDDDAEVEKDNEN